MATIAVPYSNSGTPPKRQADFTGARRQSVPILRRFRGLAVTVTTGSTPGFTITHTATGCCIPSMTGLPYEVALGLAEVLSTVFPWHLARDPFFFKTMAPDHQTALRDCILSLREMFGVE